MSKKLYQFSQAQVRKAQRLWQEGKPQHEVSQAIGVTRYVFEYAREHGALRSLKKRPKGGKGVSSTKNYTPTPDQIKDECAKIQKKWSGSEIKDRWIGRPFGGPIE